MAKGANLRDHLEVAVTVKEEDVVIHGDLGDATVDGTAHGLAGSAEIEIDSRRTGPRLRTAFQVDLGLQLLMKEAPFPLIARTLQQFELVKAAQDGFISVERSLECRSSSTGAIAKDLNPYRGIDQDQPRNFRTDLGSNPLRNRIRPARSARFLFLRERTSSCSARCTTSFFVRAPVTARASSIRSSSSTMFVLMACVNGSVSYTFQRNPSCSVAA